MTIKELKSKIEAIDRALRFPALPNDNATLQASLKDILLELQGDLIKKLVEKENWDLNMTDEEHEKALNNIG